MTDVPTKTCKLCGESKPLDDFYVDTRLKDGRQNRCKVCHLAQCKAKYRGTRRVSKEAVARAAEANRTALRVLPMTRGECCTGMRPCPFVSCIYNCALDYSPRTGSIKLAYGSDDVDDWREDNCALDHADEGGMTHEAIAEKLGMVRERVRQIEETALRKLRNNAVVLKALQGALEEM